MLAAFRWNLRMLSGIALLVGAFLIYNAVSVSVVRRRADIGTMRALGASRGAVMVAFLLEAALFGTAGSLAALPLGRMLAAGAVGMLSTTVNALYVSSSPGAMTLSAGSVMLALVAGIGVAVGSALAPAREASMVPPTEAMARGRREFEVRVDRKRDAWIALVLAVLGTLAALARRSGESLCWGTCRPCSLSLPPRCSLRWWCTAPPRRGRWGFAAYSESRHCLRRAAWADRCAERRCWWRRWPRPSP
jgi:putative ABC transport system permease protein